MNTTQRFRLIPAVYLLLKNNGKILLMQRANTGYQDGNYSLIAGHVDGGELATHAIAREAAEEIGITIEPADLRHVHTAHRLNLDQNDQERVDLFFETDRWSGDPLNKEPEKCSDLRWFDENDLPENLIPFIKNVLDLVSKGITFSEYSEEPK